MAKSSSSSDRNASREDDPRRIAARTRTAVLREFAIPEPRQGEVLLGICALEFPTDPVPKIDFQSKDSSCSKLADYYLIDVW
jgi:hypothetical protein